MFILANIWNTFISHKSKIITLGYYLFYISWEAEFFLKYILSHRSPTEPISTKKYFYSSLISMYLSHCVAFHMHWMYSLFMLCFCPVWCCGSFLCVNKFMCVCFRKKIPCVHASTHLCINVSVSDDHFFRRQFCCYIPSLLPLFCNVISLSPLCLRCCIMMF